ncbi:Ca(2+)-dependent cysteine protease [Irineochytrium annulatum]|nr:Ca(2+)-dependent cysteine protease [Irineochytrium annulatum]
MAGPVASPSTEDSHTTPTVKRKALLIGINYFDSDHPLKGPRNDIRNVHTWLTYNYPFHPSDILVLSDDQRDRNKQPTRDNILRGMRWLVKDAAPGDRFFFHFSGHGGAVLDEDGDEVDGMDETILPVDYRDKGEILDDDIYKIMVSPLPAGSRLTAIFDCCHSGSVMDLQYSYKVDDGGLLVQQNDDKAPILHHVARGFREALAGHRSTAKAEMHTAYKFFKLKERRQPELGEAESTNKEALERRKTEADVIQFSACNDMQTAADVEGDDNAPATGIMSWALLTSLKDNQHPTLLELFKKAGEHVRKQYSKQSVTLSTGRPMDIANTTFSVL